ncbi:MAG: hypothetical protein ABJP70_13815 [Erythrobacter sp.]
MIEISETRRRGTPLLMLGLVVFSWVGARAMLWENPFPSFDVYAPNVSEWIAFSSPPMDQPITAQEPALVSPAYVPILAQKAHVQNRPSAITAILIEQQRGLTTLAYKGRRIGTLAMASAGSAQMSLGHRLLFSQAFSRSQLPLAPRKTLYNSPPGLGFSQGSALSENAQGQAQGLKTTRADRWSFDSWAFFRQGSNTLTTSQGRVPTYGASQLGAVFQYRLAPASRRDPKAYVRVYRALTSTPENELAIGFGTRLAPSIPVRVQAEARLTNNAFGTEVRPAILAVTELQAQSLPAGVKAEGYAQGGYVGGAADTGFIEGQVAITRQVKSFDLSKTKNAKISVGAAAWGGAQRDAQRIDLGPSVRMDLIIGAVPARVSVDWRERVAGSAEPGSGVAATISTRF